ncbi:MAG: MraY family glycosyltransferase [Acidobacteriota bacterium]
MKPELAVRLIVACILALLLTPVMTRLAPLLGFLDRPGRGKRQRWPVPLLGGLAVFTAVMGAIFVYPGRPEVRQQATIFAAASWILLWGLWDDRRSIPAPVKLAAETIGALVLMLGGIGVDLPLPAALNVTLSLLWVVGITNAFNLLDNMDGLASGIGAVAAGFFLLLAAHNGEGAAAALAAAVAGACLGFLAYNLSPASILLGDSGSLFLGFIFAVVGIEHQSPRNPQWVIWMVSMLVLGVPIFDTTLVVVSRLRRGLNPLTSPGRDHLSHRLVSLGWTPRQSVFLLYVLGAALGSLAVVVSLVSVVTASIVGLAVSLLALWALIRLERQTLADT